MAKRNNKSSNESTESRSPADRVRLGRVEAAIWRNESEKGAFYSVTLTRSYRNGESWKNTASFGRDDLLIAAKVLNLAHTRVCELLAADREAARTQAA